jgi:DNA (cytosine-5)-methyltransferase 1
VNVIDFFCGCGGVSEGLRQAGCNISLGIDIDPNTSKTYRANFPEAAFIERDITQVSVSEVAKIVVHKGGKKVPLLFTACAPCQPFSNQNKFKSDDDARKSLLDEVHRFINELLPEYIMIENVPGMQNVDESKDGPYKKFVFLLCELGYKYISFIAKAENYGVPQRRKRLVLIASRLGPMTIPNETHGDGLRPYSTVRDYIGCFPAIDAGDVCKIDHLHRTARMNELNITRIKNTPEGGDRRNWPAHLVNNCHKEYSGHTDTYGRMKWDFLAPTLTTKCNSYSNGRFGHPDVNQHRAISIREAARLQTFPMNYQFQGTIGSMARQVGNAVPCLLAQQFGLSILEHYQYYSE